MRPVLDYLGSRLEKIVLYFANFCRRASDVITKFMSIDKIPSTLNNGSSITSNKSTKSLQKIGLFMDNAPNSGLVRNSKKFRNSMKNW